MLQTKKTNIEFRDQDGISRSLSQNCRQFMKKNLIIELLCPDTIEFKFHVIEAATFTNSFI